MKLKWKRFDDESDDMWRTVGADPFDKYLIAKSYTNTQKFVLYRGYYIGEYGSLAEAKRAAQEHADKAVKKNPMSPSQRNEVGSAILFTVAGLVALYAVSKVVHTGSSGSTIGFGPQDTNTITPAKVGDTLEFTLPFSAAGQSWQPIITDATGVLPDAPSTSTTSGQEIDTYVVQAAGAASIAYQLYDVNNNPVGTPLNFEIEAT